LTATYEPDFCKRSNDEDLTVCRPFGEHGQHGFEPVGAGVQPTIAARYAQAARQIAGLLQQHERAFVVVVKVFGGDQGNGEHLSIRHAGKLVILMTGFIQQLIEDHEDGYNPFGVHQSGS